MLALGEEILEDQVDRFAGRTSIPRMGYPALIRECRACSVSTRRS